MHSVRSRARALVQSFGLDITPFRPMELPEVRRARILAHHRVDLVYDVGANVGQYGSLLRRHGYTGRIVSLEPQRAACEALQQAAASDPQWTAIHAAAGASTGTATVHLSANSVSSSLLAMHDAHLAAAPQSAIVGTEQAPLTTMDALAREYDRGARRPFLKIDTQGYEAAVLDGAPQLLARCVGVQVEMSLRPMYDGEAPFVALFQRLTALQFRPVGFETAFFDPASGETYQVDGTFVR